jgi:hypothetical protein
LELSAQCRRRAGGRLRGKRFGEVQAQWREDFAEEQQDKTQKRDRNGRRNTEVGHLAEPAVWFVVAAGVRVRHNLQ